MGYYGIFILILTVTLTYGAIFYFVLRFAMIRIDRWQRIQRSAVLLSVATSPVWFGGAILFMAAMSTHGPEGVLSVVMFGWIPSLIASCVLGAALRSFWGGTVMFAGTMLSLWILMETGGVLMFWVNGGIWLVGALASIVVGLKTPLEPRALFAHRGETASLGCWKCGYDLSGIEANACPECGDALSERQIEFLAANKSVESPHAD